LPLSNGWHAYSARPVKVGRYGDVVRFQGAISGGTSNAIGSLPVANPSYAPPKTVRLTAVANGPVPVVILINPNGSITYAGAPENVVSLYLSLDGLSYGL